VAKKVSPTPNSHIAGPIKQHQLFRASASTELRASVIVFEAGSATGWHKHEVGQILHALGGDGFVETEQDGLIHLEQGDTVVAEAGERHRHGAGPDHAFTQLTCSYGVTDWE
jgi:quercetin dioxygenase-like cupin family protein